MAVNQDTLYVKGDRNVEVTKREVTLGDLVSMECSNRVILPHLKTMKVLKIPENGEKRYVISILKIIACIHEKYPGLEVQNLGETDLIVTYEMQKTPSKWVHVAKTILVVLITFFGAAFSMMAFNNDVDVDKLFWIYLLLDDRKTKQRLYNTGGLLFCRNYDRDSGILQSFWKEAVFCGSDADGGADASV